MTHSAKNRIAPSLYYEWQENMGVNFLRGSENWAGRSQLFGYISKLEEGSQLKVAIHNREVLECIFQRLFR